MIILRNKNYSEVDPIFELNYDELCRQYPKLKELKFFIDNSKKLSDIEFYLDKYRIAVDWQGLECDLYDINDPEYSGVSILQMK